MSSLDLRMSTKQRNDASRPPATLEFKQAMRDFKTMFPTLDSELIECVLRSNSGHVDATVDQLLQLSRDCNGRTNASSRRYQGRRIAVDDDTTDSEDSVHSEFLDVPTSSDDDMAMRDPPPMYTPHADVPVPFFPAPSYPLDDTVLNKLNKKSPGRQVPNGYKHRRKYNHYLVDKAMLLRRAWNPPMLGTLPDDFLRILPQQQLPDHPSEENGSQKSSNHRQGHQFVSKPELRSLVATNDPAVISQALGMMTNAPEILGPPPGLTGPAIDDSTFGDGGYGNESTTPPPRPPRSMQMQHPKRRTQSYMGHRPARFDPDNAPVHTGSDVHQPHADSHRSRRHHHSSRQHQSTRSSQSHRCSSNCNHSRRGNDFTSRRMVMVSRLSEPALPITQGDMPNGFDRNHSPSTNNRSHRAVTRTSSNHVSSHSRHSSQRNELQWYPAQSRSSQRPSSSSSNSSRSRPRTSVEEDQYVEDCRLAILLQNEEFIRELKRNDEFLKELEKDRPNTSETATSNGDKDIVPTPDPDAKYPHGVREGSAVPREVDESGTYCQFYVPEFESDLLFAITEKDDKAFKENLKHMGKCDDEFLRKNSVSPTFDLNE